MSNSNRVTKTLVSNVVAANTGTTVATAVNNDVLLVNRANTVVADAGTVVSDASNDVVRVALGVSAIAGTVKWSSPIHVRSIRKVSTSLYEVPVQHVIAVNGSVAVPATSAAGTAFNIKIQYKDTNRIMQDKGTEQFFSYTTLVANETAEVIFTALAAKITSVATASKQVSAAVTGDDGAAVLTITGLAVTDNAFGLPQFRYFDLALRSGFLGDATGATTTTAGKPGRGTADMVKQLELLGIYDFNRISWPQDTDTRRGTAGVYYNFVTIEHGTPHLSSLHSTYVAPETTIIAFAAAETTSTTAFDGAGTPIASAKQTAFMTKLTSLVESAGIFVA